MGRSRALEDLLAFGPNADQIADEILSNREDLKGTLFFDRLLMTVGIDKPSKLYPPRSNAELQRLLTRINDSKSPIHHQQSLIYYVLKDLDQGGPLPSSRKAAKAGDLERSVIYFDLVHLPSKYATLMDGLWNLDRQQFEHALISLTSPSLIPTFTEETLLVLAENPRSNPSLVLAYYHAVAPEIQSREVLDAVFACMVQASVTEAFFFARQQGGSVHRHLLEELIAVVLGQDAGEVKAQMAEELVGLPLNAEESDWFPRYLSSEKGRSLPGSHDVLIMRMLLLGRLDNVERVIAKTEDKQVNGLGWRSLLRSAGT